jgi:uncharacterized protein
MVTGCTAGIGEKITYRLARSGAVNLVLIGRSMEKLIRVEKKCKEINRKVQVRIIQADLCKEALQISKYEEIRRQCEDLKIVLLINNAGVLYNGYFKDQTAEQIREQVIVNTYPYVLLTRALISNIQKAGKRSCIMNLASSASFQP